MTAYQVRLQDFEGPLDLLLHLIRKNELDIYSVSVAEIANQYLEYIELMETLNLDGVGDFLVMAATLAYHKSKMLLPTPSVAGEEEGEEYESLESLHRRLMEYQRYKEAAQSLADRPLLGREVFKVRLPADDGRDREPERTVLRATLFDLLDAFQRIMRQAPKDTVHALMGERVRLVDRIVEVFDLLVENRSMQFDRLFLQTPSREMIIVTFLSILELVRMGLIHAYQFEPFGPVHLSVVPGGGQQRQRLKENLQAREAGEG